MSPSSPLGFLQLTIDTSKSIIDELNKFTSNLPDRPYGQDLQNGLARVALPGVTSPSNYVKLICKASDRGENYLQEVRLTMPYSICHWRTSGQFDNLQPAGESSTCNLNERIILREVHPSHLVSFLDSYLEPSVSRCCFES